MKKIRMIIFFCLGLISGQILALDFKDKIKKNVMPEIADLVKNETIQASIKEQNTKHASISQAEILELDKTWRKQHKAKSKPMIEEILKKEGSVILKEFTDNSDKKYTEIFLTDNKGLNVVQSHETSYYWKGDEAKFTKVFSKGKRGKHISSLEYDELTQSMQSQFSMTVVNENDELIGTVNVGVNMNEI